VSPQRIQRKRTKGWRMPEGALYVGRPTRWGNPFVAGRTIVPPVDRYQPKPIHVRDAAHATLLYAIWLKSSAARIEDLVPLLGGHDLACWCPLGSPCHADVLLKLANPTHFAASVAARAADGKEPT
jgi:hypothetical protein